MLYKILPLILTLTSPLIADDLEDVQTHEFIKTYPAIKQQEMLNKWLKNHEPGQWQFSGRVTSQDRTVVTPQADVNYGYSWFNVSENPVVVTLPKYKHYYSLSVFDMNHRMQVKIRPTIPTVIRRRDQKSPLRGKYNDIVIDTNWGLAFTRHQMLSNDREILRISKDIKITKKQGNKPFIVQSFTKDVAQDGLEIIQEYAKKNVTNGRKLFCSPYEGCGALDVAAGVMVGQLGTQSYVVDYRQYNVDQNDNKLTGDKFYQIKFSSKDFGLRNKKGYWSVTVYNKKDRYLIPNEGNKYVISSTSATTDKDGSITVNINPDGSGINGIPNDGKDFYAVARFYEPKAQIDFPQIRQVSSSSLSH